jgi:hypothetical protein
MGSTDYNKEYPEVIEGHKREILRFENIRQIYLNKGLDADWVNKRIDNFIDKENERLARFTRVMLYQRQRVMKNIKN